MSTAEKPRERFTYGDYLRWPEGERWELIDGEEYDMSPAPGVSHQTLVAEFYVQLRSALQGKPCRPFMAPLDVRLPRGDEADEQVDTVVQPDVLVVCDDRKIDERGVRGAPDFVIEIASPSTAVKDEIVKTRTYERGGVREYWIVRPLDRIIEIRVLTECAFSAPRFVEGKGKLPISVLGGFEIDLDEVFAAIAYLGGTAKPSPGPRG